MQGPLPQHRQLQRYLRRIQVRAVGLAAIRGVLCGLALACTWLALSALWIGPVATPVASGIGIVGALGWVFASAWRFARPLLAQGERGTARFIEVAGPGLGSRTLSALSLATGDAALGSPMLSRAHVEHTWQQLSKLPPERVVPFAVRGDRLVRFSGAWLLLMTLAALGSPRLRDGLYALAHPAPLDASGTRVADVVADLEVTLHFPGYLARADETLLNPHEIRVPRGTSIELRMQARMDSEAAELSIAGLAVPLARHGAREFGGQLVARDTGELQLRAMVGSSWVRDRAVRELVTLVDAAPLVELLAPTDGMLVAADEAVELAYRASDDAGLATIELEIIEPSGVTSRRRLWTAQASGRGPEVALDLRSALMLSELRARPGDIIALTLEATDSSVIDGPNRARSATVRIEIASDAGEKQQLRQALREVLDHMLDALAERLETPIPAVEDRVRAERVAGLTRAMLSKLDSWIGAVGGDDAVTRIDRESLRDMRSRHRRLLTEEEALLSARNASLPARTQADARAVAALEQDGLFLHDLLGRTHLAEAQALAAELKQIRDQLQTLIARLKDSDDPEARKDVLAAIARAQQRLERLMKSLAALSDSVPGEFVNTEALRQQMSKQALSALESAVRSDNLDAAQEQLANLTRDVDELMRALRDGTLSFTQDRFGERNRALEQARSELAALSQAQERLAQRSGQTLQQLGERWTREHGSQAASPALRAKADAAQQALEQIERRELGAAENQTLDRAAQRLDDTRAALSTGDLTEASRMADLAAESAHDLQRDLDIMRRMFPGTLGESTRNAELAQRAATSLDALRSGLEQRRPDVSEGMTPGERAGLAADADPQRDLRQGTQRLAETLDRGGEQGSLHPGGAHGLRDAERAMQRAEQALRRGDAQAAASSQVEAHEHLEAVNEALEQSLGGGQREGEGERDGAEGDGPAKPGRVGLPHDRSSANRNVRDKLMDGMQSARPAGLEGAVERYYRELLE